LFGSGAINFRSFRTKEASETPDIITGNNKSNSKACVLIVIELQYPQTHTFDGKYRKNNIGREIRGDPFQIEIRGWRGSGEMEGKTKKKKKKKKKSPFGMESAREGRRKTEKIGIGIEIGTKLRELRITKRKKKMEDLTQSTSSEILRRKNETKRTTRIRHYGLGSGWKWASLLELMLPAPH